MTSDGVGKGQVQSEETVDSELSADCSKVLSTRNRRMNCEELYQGFDVHVLNLLLVINVV